MIAKYLWEKYKIRIYTFYHPDTNFFYKSDLYAYSVLIVIIIFTPILFALDILLLPIEVAYYIFKKKRRKELFKNR